MAGRLTDNVTAYNEPRRGAASTHTHSGAPVSFEKKKIETL
jgi:hypothetical protein